MTESASEQVTGPQVSLTEHFRASIVAGLGMTPAEAEQQTGAFRAGNYYNSLTEGPRANLVDASSNPRGPDSMRQDWYRYSCEITPVPLTDAALGFDNPVARAIYALDPVRDVVVRHFLVSGKPGESVNDDAHILTSELVIDPDSEIAHKLRTFLEDVNHGLADAALVAALLAPTDGEGEELNRRIAEQRSGTLAVQAVADGHSKS